MSQLATTMAKIETQVYGKLPSQNEISPKETFNAIAIKIGKQPEGPNQDF